MFTGPVDFSSGGAITFDVTVDKDNPAHEIDPPYSGGTTTAVRIDLAVVDAPLGTAAGGIVSTYGQYISVLATARAGSGATASYVAAYPSGCVQHQIALVSTGASSHDGSQLSITNFASVMDPRGLPGFGDVWGSRGNAMSLTFSPSKVYHDVVVIFDFRINSDIVNYAFDRKKVDSVLDATTAGWRPRKTWRCSSKRSSGSRDSKSRRREIRSP